MEGLSLREVELFSQKTFFYFSYYFFFPPMCKRIKISRLKKKKKTLCQESCQNSLSQKYNFKYVFFPQVKTKRGSENTKQIT